MHEHDRYRPIPPPPLYRTLAIGVLRLITIPLVCVPVPFLVLLDVFLDLGGDSRFYTGKYLDWWATRWQ